MGRAVESSILTVLRLGLGGLFVFAAVAKLGDAQKFAFAVKAFKILPPQWTALAAYVVPWTEGVCGLFLILGLWTRSAALVLSTMLLAFIVAILSVLHRDLDVTCSCFGKFEIPCTGPVGLCHVARNLVLFAAVAWILARGPGYMSVDALRAGRRAKS